MKLLKMHAFLCCKSTNTHYVDLIGSCWGHGVIMFRRKSSAVSAFVLKLLFIKFQLVCYVLYKIQIYNYF